MKSHNGGLIIRMKHTFDYIIRKVYKLIIESAVMAVFYSVEPPPIHREETEGHSK